MESVLCSIDEVKQADGDAAVVIDVLRAFTVACWIFAQGAGSLRLTETDEGALALKERLGAKTLALKDGRPAPGFDLVNSPGMIARRDLSGYDVVQRTANGTVGVHAARGFGEVLCASLVNASATAQHLQQIGARRVHFVVTGDGGTAREDLACADLVMAIIRGEDFDPESYRQRVESSESAGRIRADLLTDHGGFHEDDIPLAGEIDRFPFALRAVADSDHFLVRQLWYEKDGQ